MGWSLSSFLFELINFLVLVLILQRLVYRPLRAGIEQRRQDAAAKEQAVEQRMQAAEALEASSRARLSELDELRTATLRQATEQADEERARLLAQAREDAGLERAHAERLLQAERESARAWVREMAVEHSTTVAGRLLLELAPEAIERSLFDRLLVELSRRGPELRGALPGDGGAGSESEVEVTCAQPLGADEQRRLRAQLAELLGAPPRLVVRDDGALGAGLVLRVGHLVLDASLAGELDVLRERVRGLSAEEAGLG